jgi:hypothetical protein
LSRVQKLSSFPWDDSGGATDAGGGVFVDSAGSDGGVFGDSAA